MLGRLKGKEGVVADIAIQYMGLREFAKAHYQEELSHKTLKILEFFVAGLNDFAARYPEEVLVPEAFPILPVDVVTGYMLGLVEISGAGGDLRQIMDGSIIQMMKTNFPRGSNAIAISSRRTAEGKTFLAVNSHQPLEGWYSWYEAHLVSDEGLNILGGTFPGGICIFHGVNEHLGWAHTVNHADFSDVYKLTMHPTKPLLYQVEDEWLKLDKKIIWAWVKVNRFLRIPIRRIMYESIYGNVFKTDEGFFAWRFIAGESVSAIEQWYRMNKARNYDEFREALDLQGIPCTNIVYADKEDNIFYLSNAKVYDKDDAFDWTEVVPGNTKTTLWKDKYWPVDSMAQVENPTSGFVFNTNNTPYSSSDSLNNPTYKPVQKTFNYQSTHQENNRSLRFLELINQKETIDYQDFLRIKFDRTYPQSLRQRHILNLELLVNLDSTQFVDIASEISLLHHWNRSTDPENRVAPLFLISLAKLNSILREEGAYMMNGMVTVNQCAKAIRQASDELKSNFGRVAIPLGSLMRHIRGNVDLPIGGGSDVLAAIYGSPLPDGRYRATSGESYILMAQFDTEGLPILESIHAYGSSAESDSPHFTDQMEFFVNQKLKPVTLDLEKVKNQSRMYHPG